MSQRSTQWAQIPHDLALSMLQQWDPKDINSFARAYSPAWGVIDGQHAGKVSWRVELENNDLVDGKAFSDPNLNLPDDMKSRLIREWALGSSCLVPNNRRDHEFSCHPLAKFADGESLPEMNFFGVSGGYLYTCYQTGPQGPWDVDIALLPGGARTPGMNEMSFSIPYPPKAITISNDGLKVALLQVQLKYSMVSIYDLCGTRKEYQLGVWRHALSGIVVPRQFEIKGNYIACFTAGSPSDGFHNKAATNVIVLNWTNHDIVFNSYEACRYSFMSFLFAAEDMFMMSFESMETGYAIAVLPLKLKRDDDKLGLNDFSDVVSIPEHWWPSLSARGHRTSEFDTVRTVTLVPMEGPISSNDANEKWGFYPDRHKRLAAVKLTCQYTFEPSLKIEQIAVLPLKSIMNGQIGEEILFPVPPHTSNFKMVGTKLTWVTTHSRKAYTITSMDFNPHPTYQPANTSTPQSVPADPNFSSRQWTQRISPTKTVIVSEASPGIRCSLKPVVTFDNIICFSSSEYFMKNAHFFSFGTLQPDKRHERKKGRRVVGQ